jgi:hypothetical protein
MLAQDCPHCQKTNHHRESSVGTLQNCKWCGGKYEVVAPPSSLPLLLALVSAVGIPVVLCMGVCGGIGNLFSDNPGRNKIQQVNVPQQPQPSAIVQSPATSDMLPAPTANLKLAEIVESEPVVEEKPINSLPPHKFKLSSSKRSQIRVFVIPPKSEDEWKEIAVRLCTHPSTTHYLVYFFDDESALKDWDGTGELRESDIPHWLCKAVVDDGKVTSFTVVKAGVLPSENIQTATQQIEAPAVKLSRTWTDLSGKFSVEAEFAGMTDEIVSLKKKDGTVVKVPLDRLSEEDAKWIKNIHTHHAPHAPSTSKPLPHGEIHFVPPEQHTTMPAPHSAGGSVHVQGYTRKDGTYVHPYNRSAPRR